MISQLITLEQEQAQQQNCQITKKLLDLNKLVHKKRREQVGSPRLNEVQQSLIEKQQRHNELQNKNTSQRTSPRNSIQKQADITEKAQINETQNPETQSTYYGLQVLTTKSNQNHLNKRSVVMGHPLLNSPVSATHRRSIGFGTLGLKLSTGLSAIEDASPLVTQRLQAKYPSPRTSTFQVIQDQVNGSNQINSTKTGSRITSSPFKQVLHIIPEGNIEKNKTQKFDDQDNFTEQICLIENFSDIADQKLPEVNFRKKLQSLESNGHNTTFINQNSNCQQDQNKAELQSNQNYEKNFQNKQSLFIHKQIRLKSKDNAIGKLNSDLTSLMNKSGKFGQLNFTQSFKIPKINADDILPELYQSATVKNKSNIEKIYLHVQPMKIQERMDQYNNILNQSQQTFTQKLPSLVNQRDNNLTTNEKKGSIIIQDQGYKQEINQISGNINQDLKLDFKGKSEQVQKDNQIYSSRQSQSVVNSPRINSLNRNQRHILKLNQIKFNINLAATQGLQTIQNQSQSSLSQSQQDINEQVCTNSIDNLEPQTFQQSMQAIIINETGFQQEPQIVQNTKGEKLKKQKIRFKNQSHLQNNRSKIVMREQIQLHQDLERQRIQSLLRNNYYGNNFSFINTPVKGAQSMLNKSLHKQLKTRFPLQDMVLDDEDFMRRMKLRREDIQGLEKSLQVHKYYDKEIQRIRGSGGREIEERKNKFITGHRHSLSPSKNYQTLEVDSIQNNFQSSQKQLEPYTFSGNGMVSSQGDLNESRGRNMLKQINYASANISNSVGGPNNKYFGMIRASVDDAIFRNENIQELTF